MSRAEFCLYMLVKLGRIDEDELQAVQEVFDIYDLNNDGTLTDADTVAANTEIDPDYAEDELRPGANDLVIDLSAEKVTLRDVFPSCLSFLEVEFVFSQFAGLLCGWRA